jgi:hypothetical protein
MPPSTEETILCLRGLLSNRSCSHVLIGSLSLQRAVIDASREREQQEAARTEYREALTAASKGKKLNKANVASLRDLVDNKLKLSPSTAAVIESEVMGDTIGGILQRQEREATKRTAE